MGNPRITYNSKNIDLPKLPRESSFQVLPQLVRTVNTGMSGITDTITFPRVDVQVICQWRLTDGDVRWELENFWNWAQQGLAWTFAIDSAKTVSTVLTGAEAAGQGDVDVDSVTGITVGQRYVMKDGPNYQVVKVDSEADPTIGIEETVENNMSAASIFRDQFFWAGELRGVRGSPFRDRFHVVGSRTTSMYEFTLDFFEAP